MEGWEIWNVTMIIGYSMRKIICVGRYVLGGGDFEDN